MCEDEKQDLRMAAESIGPAVTPRIGLMRI